MGIKYRMATPKYEGVQAVHLHHLTVGQNYAPLYDDGPLMREAGTVQPKNPNAPNKVGLKWGGETNYFFFVTGNPRYGEWFLPVDRRGSVWVPKQGGGKRRKTLRKKRRRTRRS